MRKIILNDSQKNTIRMYLYENVNYVFLFEYLNILGVAKEDYNSVIKSIK